MATSVKVGDKVTTDAKTTYDGTISLSSIVRQNTYLVIQVGGKNLPSDRIVIGTLDGKTVIAAVKLSTLTVVSEAGTTSTTETTYPSTTTASLNQSDYNPGRYVIQVAAFKTKSDADEFIANNNYIKSFMPYIIKDNNLYKVRLGKNGSYSSYNNASTSLTQIINYAARNNLSYTDAFIIDLQKNNSSSQPIDTNQGTNNNTNNNTNTSQQNPIQGESVVQYLSNKFTAQITDDIPSNVNNIVDTPSNKYTVEEQEKMSINDPSIVQNNFNFPAIKEEPNKANGNMYKYDYYMDYSKDTIGKYGISNDFTDMRQSVNIDIMDRNKVYQYYTKYYNKYKLKNPNDQLTKSFPHVFIMRPDCNIFPDKPGELNQQLAILSEFYYANKHCPEMLNQLTQTNSGYNHDFMLYLSNKAESMQINDEYIGQDTYGPGLTGYKIPYGKDNVGSRTSAEFSINYIDDRDLHIYNLHKLWIDYISYQYRGIVSPKTDYIWYKIIDYATCLYYFLCAEDGETIIFWSKYWGVFPTQTSSSKYSFSLNGGPITTPEIEIQYKYAWKEDFNPLSIVEFNTHYNHAAYSKSVTSESELDFNYINHYQDTKLGTGYTWSGIPFVETFRGNNSTVPYTFKLRFRKAKGLQ